MRCLLNSQIWRTWTTRRSCWTPSLAQSWIRSLGAYSRTLHGAYWRARMELKPGRDVYDFNLLALTSLYSEQAPAIWPYDVSAREEESLLRIWCSSGRGSGDHSGFVQKTYSGSIHKVWMHSTCNSGPPLWRDRVITALSAGPFIASKDLPRWLSVTLSDLEHRNERLHSFLMSVGADILRGKTSIHSSD